MGSHTVHSTAKPGLLYDSWHRYRSCVFESRIELSRVCRWANSKKVGCSYMLSVLFFPILDLYVCISNCYGMKLYYVKHGGT